MPVDGKTTHLRVDGYTRFCLTAIAVLLTVLIIGLWAEVIHPPGGAYAAEPFGVDAGAQRNAMIKAMGQTNTKLDELIGLLKTGRAKVQLVQAPVKKPRGANALPARKN